MITAAIILMLFSVQSRGTERIGKAFGSVVLVWFSFLAVVGLANLSQYWSVFAALNPVYGVRFLFSSHNAAGLAIMGTVFLSTTGAEALYSDMGHVGPWQHLFHVAVHQNRACALLFRPRRMDAQSLG